MAILVVADRYADFFRGAVRLPIGMLPIGGAPVLMQLIEQLTETGIKEFSVVGPPDDDAFRCFMRRFIDTRIKPTFIARAPERALERTLVVRGDMWIDPLALHEAIALHRDSLDIPSRLLAKGIGGAGDGCLVPTWLEMRAAMLRRAHGQPDLLLHAMTNAADYLHMATMAASDRLPVLVRSGWPDASGAYIGLDSEILTHYPMGAGVQIGARTKIEKDVVLGAGALIGDDCVIAEGANIANSVILPNTTIPSGLRLRNSIASGEYILGIDTSMIIKIASGSISAAAIA